MNDEITINLDLKDLGVRLVRRWKRILLFCVVGALIFGMLGAVKNYRSYQSKLRAAESQQLETIDLDALQESLGLNDWEVSDIKLAADSYLILKQEYEETLCYISNSPLLQLDANQCSYITIQYGVVVEDAVYPVIEKQDNRAAILSAFSLELAKEETKEQLGSVLMPEVDSVYVGEVVVVSSDVSRYILTVTLYGGTESASEEAARMVDDIIADAVDSVKSIYGEFEIKKLGANYYEDVANASLLSTQQSWYNTVNSLRNSMYSVTNTLNTNQKEYYYSLMESITAPEELEEDAGTLSSEPVFDPISKKMIVLGALFGIIVACGWIVLRYCLSKKLRIASDLKDVFGILVLGEHTLKQIERQQEQVKKWSAVLQLGCVKNGYKTIFLTGFMQEEREKEIAEQIALELKGKGLNLNYGPSIIGDAESAERMAQADAVVLMERIDASTYSGIRAECDICKQNGLPILGAIVLR